MASANSTPPAPPPTMVKCSGGPAASSRRQAGKNRPMGFTGVTNDDAAKPPGVPPVLIDKTSKRMGGRPANRTHLSARSSPVASAATNRAPANAAKRTKSMCISSAGYQPATWPGNMPE